MKKKCKNCGHNCEGDYCFRHKPRSPLPKIGKKKQEAPEENNFERECNFFLSIWKKRAHKSEISGEPLGSEPLSIYFHHILPKNKYSLAEFDEDNIILLTFEEHQNAEADMYKYEEINTRREKLKQKYGI